MKRCWSRVLLLALVLAPVGCNRDPATVRLSGVVESTPVVLVASADGVLGAVRPGEGQPVEAGELVAVIESPALAAELRAGEAAVHALRAQIEELKKAAALQVARLRAASVSAKRTLEVARQLRQRAVEELEQYKAKPPGIRRRVEGGRLVEEQSEAGWLRWDLAKDRLALARAQEVSAEQACEQAEAALRLAELESAPLAELRARLAQQRQRLEAVKELSTRLELRSPIAGVVAMAPEAAGLLVRQGTPVAMVYDLAEVWVDVWVEEGLSSRIEVGETLPVELADGRSVEGRIESITPAAEFTVQRDVDRVRRDIRAFRMRVGLRGEGLRPGMSADVYLR